MDPKDTALDDFLKAFRISLNFIQLYSPEHKSFLKSLSELKHATESLFSYLDPIEISFSADAIIADKTAYAKLTLHRELAGMFHLRKIQSFSICRGVKPEELEALLTIVGRTPKEIIRAGGAAALLKAAGGVSHCSIVDLDYSQLLKGGGEEVRDIWAFMLRRTVSDLNEGSVEAFMKDFELIADRISPADLMGDEELRRHLVTFLKYLDGHDRQKLLRAATAMFAGLIREGGYGGDPQRLSSFKELLGALSADDFMALLWNRVVSDEQFDAQSFELFAKLVDPSAHERIAQGIAGLARGQGGSAAAAKKLKDLFFRDKSLQIPEVYRKALAFIKEETSGPAAYSFDRGQLTYNYRFMLLDLVMIEPSHKRLAAVLEKLLQEWDAIVAEKNPEFWRCLTEVIQKRAPECGAIAEFAQVSKQVFRFLETLAWEESLPEGWQGLAAQVDESSFDAEMYLKKIFEEDIVSTKILSQFLRFFGNDLNGFYARLQEKRNALDLISRIVSSVAATGSPHALAVMENIFAFSHEVIKIEVLQSMRASGMHDAAFIFGVLRTATSLVRKEAFLLLSGTSEIQKALEILLLAPNPWGRNNRVLMENLDLIVEINCVQALASLDSLKRATPFWNIALKKKIREAREKLYV